MKSDRSQRSGNDYVEIVNRGLHIQVEAIGLDEAETSRQIMRVLDSGHWSRGQ